MVNRPHPLFGLVLGTVVAGVLVAITAEPRGPAWALRSEWVYRAEVGAAVIGLLYIVVVALRLAWTGESFRRVQGPGGAGIETPAAEIETAAEEFARYKTQSQQHLERIETAVAKLNERVGLETRPR